MSELKDVAYYAYGWETSFLSVAWTRTHWRREVAYMYALLYLHDQRNERNEF